MPRLALSVLVLVPFVQPALGEAAPRLAAPPVVAAGLHATTVGAHAGGDAVEDAVIDAQRTNTSRSAVLRRWLTAGALAAGYDLEAQDGDDD